MVALVTGGWSNTGTTTAAISDSGGHVWTRAVQAVGTVSGFGGIAVIWYTYLTVSPGAMTVTTTFGGYGTSGGGKTCALRVLKGAASDQSAAAVASSVVTASVTDATLSITTTKTGSWVYGVSDQPGRTDTFTPNAATVVIDDFSNTADGIEEVEWKALAATGTPGATVLGGSYSTTEHSNNCAFEVLPALVATGPPPGSAFLTFV